MSIKEPWRLLRERYAEADLTTARLRMARIPEGAELIENPVSKAPGFKIGNVIVMAGVPAIMQAMLLAVSPRLKTGPKLLSDSVRVNAPEGQVAVPLTDCQRAFPDVAMGSYPFFEDGHTARILFCAQPDILVSGSRKRTLSLDCRRTLAFLNDHSNNAAVKPID